MPKEHTFHRVVAAERLRRRLAAFATSAGAPAITPPAAAPRAGVEGAEGAEGAGGAGGGEGGEGAEGDEGGEGGVAVPVPVPGEVPCEASAFADAVRTRGEG